MKLELYNETLNTAVDTYKLEDMDKALYMLDRVKESGDRYAINLNNELTTVYIFNNEDIKYLKGVA